MTMATRKKKVGQRAEVVTSDHPLSSDMAWTPDADVKPTHPHTHASPGSTATPRDYGDKGSEPNPDCGTGSYRA
jgi:hypothetical protein